MPRPSKLVRILRELSDAVDELSFSAPVAHVYNPLVYARRSHERYLERFGKGQKEAVFLGMNPGPFGMVQTGVPFGEIAAVRDWMGIEEKVGKPPREHPKRPVDGFACKRSEVSGRRLWSWAAARYGEAECFFERYFVHNFCPLAFLEESGRNYTPDKLRKDEREALLTVCDDGLRRLVEHLSPRLVVGIGAFAEQRARAALEGFEIDFGRMAHPSPASPAANRGWDALADRAMQELELD